MDGYSDGIVLVDHKMEWRTCICSPSIRDRVIRVEILKIHAVCRPLAVGGFGQWDMKQGSGERSNAGLGMQFEESDLASAERFVGVRSH
jgi:hypothetical protein